MTTITSIATYIPEFSFNYEELSEWFAGHFDKSAARKLRFLMKESNIKKKHAIIPDFADNITPQLFCPNGSGMEWPNLKKRMSAYEQGIVKMGVSAGQKCLDRAGVRQEAVTHFIAVSCTGLSAPGPEILIPEKLGLPENIERNAVNFMGCYAAFHALRMADRICKTEPESRVLVVCAEACSLHFLNAPDDDNLLASCLFSDGAAAVLLTSETDSAGWIPLNFSSLLLPEAKERMGWHIGDTRFEMTLSPEISGYVEQHLPDLVQTVLSKSNLNHDDIDYYALHPGGKNILNAATTALNAQPAQIEPSYNVLSEYGNMSSPSVLFVMEQIENLINQQNTDENKNIFAAAFGPGLTLEGAAFRYKA